MIAAGLSSRMNGPNKLLADLGGEKLIERTYSSLSHSSFDEIVIVTGRDDAMVKETIKPDLKNHTSFIHNSKFEQGMTTSIQAGLKKVNDADVVAICLSDMPELSSLSYNDLIEFFRNHGGSNKILAPFRQGLKGNPVFFGSDYFPQMAEHKEPNGCSAIVKANKENLLKFDTTDEAYFFDIDTPETLRAYISRAK